MLSDEGDQSVLSIFYAYYSDYQATKLSTFCKGFLSVGAQVLAAVARAIWRRLCSFDSQMNLVLRVRRIGVTSKVVTIAAVLLFAASAQAATIWTDWTSDTIGLSGSASGILNGVGVSYSGEVIAAVLNGTSNIWTPNSSFTGGTVTTSPSAVGDDIRLRGVFTGTNTITFASPVEDPVFAIWSLGGPDPALFTFAATPTLQAGGPNSLFGGSSITVLGNVVDGIEGNGVVQFGGTFSAISWTDTFDNLYAFSVGTNGLAPSPVPEPTSLILVGSGFAGVIWRLRKRR